MGKLKSIAGFIAGAAVGAAVGTAGAVLLSPKSGDELRQRARSWRAAVASEGEAARASAEQTLENRFRTLVGNPSALEDEELAAPPSTP
jgi:gas vesicle protein